VLVIVVIAGIVVVSRACYASVVVVATVSMSMSMSMSSSSSITSGEGGGPVEDELAFLVPLALVEGDEVFPAEDGTAGDAEDVADGVQTRRHHPVVLATNIHIHAACTYLYIFNRKKKKKNATQDGQVKLHPVEEVGLAVLAPERLMRCIQSNRRMPIK